MNAARYYEADVLILGGDLTGKGLVPMVRIPGGAKGYFRGKEYVLASNEDLTKFEKMIAMSGYYTHNASLDEIDELKANPSRLDTIFIELMKQRIREWIKFADERLQGTDVKIYVCPGNDDVFEIDELFGESSTIINASDMVTSVDDHHEMLNVGWANPTPWHTHRECSEEELAKKIEAQVTQLKDVKNSIFQLHAPPYESLLDTAPKLDESLKMVYGESVSAGSTAVRNAIEKYQPLLGLHGHIHESDGAIKIGRTLCVNPGSAYVEGVLQGVVVNLDKSSVRSHYSITG